MRTQLELNLGKQLNILISASHALNVRTAAVFDPTLQSASFLIVRWLLSYGPTTATLLAESTAMDQSSVSRLVTQLKQLGYVKSEPHPEDRRVQSSKHLLKCSSALMGLQTTKILYPSESFNGSISRLREALYICA